MAKKRMTGCYVTEGKNPGDILDSAKFRVFGKGHNNEDVDFTITATLVVSGAFAYGNKTCTCLDWSTGRQDCFDTRYVNVYPFKEFALGLIRQNVWPTLCVTEAAA